MLYLDVRPERQPYDLDVLIAFYNDGANIRCSCQEQAVGHVEVLI